MRVDRDQRIANFPAMEIRRLFREIGGALITVPRIQQCLRCSKRVAAVVLADLQREGFVISANGRLEASLKGSALAQATAARPLRRSCAEQLVSELIQRAKIINSDDAWAYRVEMLVVFGSFASGAERPNDVDIGCDAGGNSMSGSFAIRFTICIGLNVKSSDS